MRLIKSELTDVFIYCLDMAVLLNIDADKIIRDKLKKIKRKYPPKTMLARGDAEPGTDESYLKIKKHYRSSGLS